MILPIHTALLGVRIASRWGAGEVAPIVAVVRRQRRRVVYPLHRVGLVLALALAGGTQDVVRACLALVVNAIHGPFTAVARDALVK